MTIANYDGFKTKFIGSWDMPFASYRISDTLTKEGQFAHDGDLVAVANCDEIEFYGIGLKLIGMSEFKTGQMFVREATKISSWPDAVADPGWKRDSDERRKAITAEFSDTSLKADDHVFSLLTDAQGNPLPLYYTQNTSIDANADGTIHTVIYTVGEDAVTAPFREYLCFGGYIRSIWNRSKSWSSVTWTKSPRNTNFFASKYFPDDDV